MRLAIDTATDIASVALGEGGTLKTVESMRGARQHAAGLLPMIQRVLADGGARLQEVTEIVVGDGPGSFTGLRIGWAAAKGLAHEHDVPLIAIPSLLGAAHAASSLDKGSGPLAACYDALRGQVFGAVYAIHPDRVETVVAPGLFTLPELARLTPVPPTVAVGDGAERYRAEVESWTGKPPVALDTLPGLARSLLMLAEYDETRRPLIDDLMEPVYGRPAEAQVKWESRHGRPLPNPPR
ncbi:MAG TPA: tRNA (adenosine(37)-N6)-threonylcarbamoyltransferase complex dimerization subunit type 1 TsaB [Gemmatimonadales bacterium]|nr:tRNA (adenosine(37)-N6)-threonylcarbamoyltransferase complex dimerization subunit type 1 TsaB [Gemmatimonadales bacterium]